MFIGRFYHTIETNNRLSLPKTFREYTTNWILTRGLDGGLFGFPAQDFQQKIAELSERTFTVKYNRDFVRLMTNDAVEVEVDNNGRVQLPEYLIEFAKLQKNVVIVGSFSWIEIWDVPLYHTYVDNLESQAEDIAEHMTDSPDATLKQHHA